MSTTIADLAKNFKDWSNSFSCFPIKLSFFLKNLVFKIEPSSPLIAESLSPVLSELKSFTEVKKVPIVAETINFVDFSEDIKSIRESIEKLVNRIENIESIKGTRKSADADISVEPDKDIWVGVFPAIKK